MVPLGEDRKYRKYWVFDRLPGLFIEDYDEQPGECRPSPTPCNPTICPLDCPALQEKIKARALKTVEEDSEERSASDKENDSGLVNGTNGTGQPGGAKGLLKAANHQQQNDISKVVKEEMEDDAKAGKELDEEILAALMPLIRASNNAEADDKNKVLQEIENICTANPQTCTVHGSSESVPDKSKWLFYGDPDNLDQIIATLNARGLRESSLKEALISQKDSIQKGISQCPVYKLDPTKEPEEDKIIRKSQRGHAKKDGDGNLNFPLGTPIDEIFETTIRDLILEVEEKINMGFLGALKVPDLNVWRNAISEGLSVGSVDELDWGGKRRIKKLRVSGLMTS